MGGSDVCDGGRKCSIWYWELRPMERRVYRADGTVPGRRGAGETTSGVLSWVKRGKNAAGVFERRDVKGGKLCTVHSQIRGTDSLFRFAKVKVTKRMRYMRRTKVHDQVKPSNTREEAQVPGGSRDCDSEFLLCVVGSHISSTPTTDKTTAPPRYSPKNIVVHRHSNHTREVKAFLLTSSTNIMVKTRANPRAPTITS